MSNTYKLKIDVVGNDGITTTHDGTLRFNDLADAVEAALATRYALYDDYSNYAIKDFTVDIVPAND